MIKLFDMTVATTGINEQQAKASGIEYEKVILTQNSHAGYYPNATAMTVKLLFEKETYKILGAQIVGYDGVDKRIKTCRGGCLGDVNFVCHCFD